MYTESLRHLKRATSIVLLASFLTFIMGPIPTARAASLVNMSDTMSTLKASTASNHTIVFRTPTGVETSTDTITITFPAGFNMNALDFGDLDLAHSAGGQVNCTSPTYTNEETLAAAPAASAWGVALAGQVITLSPETTAPAIAANACVQIQIGTNATFGTTGNTQITNQATPGPYSITIGGNFGDTGVITITILSDDQVAVTAEVAQSVSFSISSNSIQFGPLTTGGTRWATTTGGAGSDTIAHTLIAGTNAASGYTITVAGPTLTANAGANTITAIPAGPVAPAPGSEQFGINFAAAGGSGAVSAPYATPSQYAYEGTAAADVVATAAGTSANTTYSARYIANIESQTEAGNYSTALTYVATANF